MGGSFYGKDLRRQQKCGKLKALFQKWTTKSMLTVGSHTSFCVLLIFISIYFIFLFLINQIRLRTSCHAYVCSQPVLQQNPCFFAISLTKFAHFNATSRTVKTDFWRLLPFILVFNLLQWRHNMQPPTILKRIMSLHGLSQKVCLFLCAVSHTYSLVLRWIRVYCSNHPFLCWDLVGNIL